MDEAPNRLDRMIEELAQDIRWHIEQPLLRLRESVARLRTLGRFDEALEARVLAELEGIMHRERIHRKTRLTAAEQIDHLAAEVMKEATCSKT